jgi:hypothetical protein
MRKLWLLACLALPACSTVSAKKGDWEFSRMSFGTQFTIGSFRIVESGGSITVELDGLQSDQVQAIKAAAEGAAKGAAKAVMP